MLFNFLSTLFSKIMFFFGKINSQKAFENPLSLEEEKECFSRLKNNDKLAEEKLVKHNLRLVAHIAKKYKGKTPQDELIAVGSIGLLKAINTFTYDKGSSFSTYATRCINNEILMMLRADKKFANQVYLDDVISVDKDGNEISLMEIISEPSNDQLESINNKMVFDQLLEIIEQKLSKREQLVIYMRFGICGYNRYTQMEISQMLNISRSYISRIEKHAIKIIKDNAKNIFFE